MFNLIPELLVGALTQVKPLSKQSRKANFIHLHLALCFIGSFFAEPACRVPQNFLCGGIFVRSSITTAETIKPLISPRRDLLLSTPNTCGS